MQKTLTYILFACTTLVYAQRNPLFFEERPINVFLRVQPAEKLQKDFTDKPHDQLTMNLLLPNKAPDSYWIHLNRFSFDFSQVSFTNWNAGGQSSIAGILDFRIRRTYEKGFVRFNNELLVRYGLNKQENTGVRKTDDDLELVSTFGYRFSKNSKWFYTARSSFKSQFANGYNYPNRDNRFSHFMAPGYFFLGAGAEYSQKENEFLVYLSPLTQKSTFVLNQRLANQGAFGVREATRDTDGNIIQRGSQVRTETGILLKNEFRKEIFDDIFLFSRISLFTDYFQNFGNIDVDWEILVDFKVNNFIKARVGSHFRYDDDINVIVQNEAGEEVNLGPKLQWKQQLGIGLLIEF